MKKILIISGIEKNFFKKVVKKNFYFFDHKKVDQKKLFNLADDNTIIFSVASGFILKNKILKKLKKNNLINFHPGSTKYPGRDSHHFASYYNEKKFGAVVHYMNQKVDSGPIIEEFLEKIEIKKPNFQAYQKLGINCVKILFKKYFRLLANSSKRINISKKKWVKKKFKRKDFLNMMKIDRNANIGEFQRKLRSFYTPGRKSLYFIHRNKKIYLNFESSK